MKINNVLILIALSPLATIAQSIDLEEDTTTNLYDSRHGAGIYMVVVKSMNSISTSKLIIK